MVSPNYSEGSIYLHVPWEGRLIQHKLRNPENQNPPRSASIPGAQFTDFYQNPLLTIHFPLPQTDGAPKNSPKPCNEQTDSPRIIHGASILTKYRWWVCSPLVPSKDQFVYPTTMWLHVHHKYINKSPSTFIILLFRCKRRDRTRKIGTRKMANSHGTKCMTCK